MSRTLTAGMQTAVASNQLEPVHLVKIEFDGGDEFHTNAYKDIVFGGNTYAPGNLMSVGKIKESLELKIPTLKIELSGVNQANWSTALTEDAIDRPITVYLGLLDSSAALIADPVEIFKGRLDSYALTEVPKNNSAIVAWSCVSHLQDFERIVGRRTNDDDQQFHFPGDDGFEYAGITTADIKWGRA